MASEKQALLDSRFCKGLTRRVKSEVRADPDLNRRYWRTLKRKMWLGVFVSPFLLAACWAFYSFMKFFLSEHGSLHPALNFSVNVVGLFIPMMFLVFSGLILCGTEVMGTLPRLPISDGAIYSRAWRRFSKWTFFFALSFWLLIYLELAWFTHSVGDVWVWIPICAVSQAFLCLGLGSVLACLNYRFGARSALCHTLWGLMAFGLVVFATGAHNLVPNRATFLLELDAMLPTHRATEVFAAFVGAGVGDLFQVLYLGLAGAALYALAGVLHYRWHPLRDVAKYTATETCHPGKKPLGKASDKIEDWSLEEEDTAFWCGGGFIERIIHAVLQPRERLVLESVSTVPLAHTRIWVLSLLSAVLLGSLALGMQELGLTPWHYIAYAPCAMAGFICIFSTTFRPFIMTADKQRTDQNPFPLLPVGAVEVFVANLKVELVKWAMVLPHGAVAGLFIWLLMGFALGKVVLAVLMVWLLVGGMLSASAMIPIMRQSDVYNLYLFRGWLSAATQVLLLCGPLLTVLVLSFRWPILFWLLIPAVLGSTIMSCQFSLWQWRMGTYDFNGNPVVSGGLGGLMANDLQNKATID